MDISDIRIYAEIMREYGLTGFEIKSEKGHVSSVRMERMIENIMDDTKIKKDSTAKNNKKIKIEEKIIENTATPH